MIQEKLNNAKINFWFLVAVSGLMFLGGIISIVFFVRTNMLADKKLAEYAEANRPANLDLVTIKDNSCKDCFNINTVVDYIKKENVKITSEKTLDKNSDEGRAILEQYTIEKLPAFVLKGEFNKLSKLTEFFSKTGDVKDGVFVFRQTGAPYTAVDTGKVKGRIVLSLLTDVTCTECYDVTQHETILKESFGINTTANILDTKSAPGQAMIRKYGIKLVPTIVIAGETDEYPGLKSVWSQVGIVAKDGTYIFTTGVPLMGTYKDLTTNKVITPAPPTQAEAAQ